jgi:integrase
MAGRKAFIVGTRINGKFRRITLKPAFPILELADARAQARRIIVDAQAGIGPELRQKREEKGTFGAVADAFMQDFAKHHRTRDEMQRRLNVDLAEWRDLPIASITRADIKERLREKAREAPISANRLGALISKIFSWALREEIIQSSPAVQLPRYGKETEREWNLTPAEIKAVWGAFGQLGHPFVPAFKMLLITGQRRGEVAGMKWSEIDGSSWLLPGERTKSGKGHRVPLSTLARDILDSLPRMGEHVFTARGAGQLKGWSKLVTTEQATDVGSGGRTPNRRRAV